MKSRACCSESSVTSWSAQPPPPRLSVPSRRCRNATLGAQTPISVIFVTGVVRATVERTQCTGSLKPSGFASFAVHAPAAAMTVGVRMGPRSVTTSVTAPFRVPIDSTVQCSMMRAPRAVAAFANAGVAFRGSACPSFGVYMPPSHSPCKSGMSCLSSPCVNTRVSSPCSRAVLHHPSNSAIRSGAVATARLPPWIHSTSPPSSRSIPDQMRFDSTISGSSSGSLPCCRTKPQLRPDCARPISSFSITTADTPRLAR